MIAKSRNVWMEMSDKLSEQIYNDYVETVKRDAVMSRRGETKVYVDDIDAKMRISPIYGAVINFNNRLWVITPCEIITHRIKDVRNVIKNAKIETKYDYLMKTWLDDSEERDYPFVIRSPQRIYINEKTCNGIREMGYSARQIITETADSEKSDTKTLARRLRDEFQL